MTALSKFFFAAAALLFTAVPSYACSSVVISGKVTPDGRPLLWKHRDSDYLQNSVKFFKGEKYTPSSLSSTAWRTTRRMCGWGSIRPASLS